MNKLAFVVEMVRALAWPGVVAWVLFVYRGPFSALISAITYLKWKDVSIEFNQKMIELGEAESSLISTKITPEAVTQSLSESRFVKLAKISPAAAITAAWKEVEIMAVQAIGRFTPKEWPSVAPQDVYKRLKELNLLDSTQLDVWSRLRHLRNLASHVPDVQIEFSSAMEYIISAERLISALRHK